MTDKPRDGWTVDTLLDHLRAVIESYNLRYVDRFTSIEEELRTGLTAVKESSAMALAAAEKAVQKAEAAAEKRFEGVNEFRSTLSDQQRTLMPRSEVDVLMNSLREKLDRLDRQFDAAQAERAGIKGGWGYAVGIIGVVLALLSIAMMVNNTFINP